MLYAVDFPRWFLVALALAWGAIWGSFANVVIYRWPEGKSLVRPGSHCPACGHPVRAWDNIPVLSWLVLRGRCRDCKARISPRYPVVELLSAVLSLAVALQVLRADPPLVLSLALARWMVQFAFAWALLVVSFIDLDTMLIPDAVTLPGVVLGVAASGLLPGGIGWQSSLLGAGLGFAIPYALYFTWSRILKRGEGMGLGDAKLLAMVGALLGPLGVLFSLGAGAMQGLVATLIAHVAGVRLGPREPLEEDAGEDAEDGAGEGDAPAPEEPAEPVGLMRTKIPFGPFLALAALEYLLGASVIMRAWVVFLRGGE